MIKLLENPLTLPLRVTCESIFGVADALVMSRSSEGYNLHTKKPKLTGRLGVGKFGMIIAHWVAV